jgi:hypothetical protein
LLPTSKQFDLFQRERFHKIREMYMLGLTYSPPNCDGDEPRKGGLGFGLMRKTCGLLAFAVGCAGS